MQSPALFAQLCRADNQFPDSRDISEFEDIGGHQIVQVVLPYFPAQVRNSTCRPLKPLVGAHDPHVVPHTGSHLVPVVFNHDCLVARHRIPGLPVRDIRSFVRIRRGQLTDLLNHLVCADHGLEQRVARQAVGAVKPRACGLTAGEEARQRGLTVDTGLDAPTEIVGRRHHGHQVAGHVEAEPQAFPVDRREPPLQELLRAVADVQVHAQGTRGFHLVVDRSRNDVTRRESAPAVVFVHELVPVRIHELRALAAYRFTNKERLRLRMVEACGMELDEFHVLDRHPGPPRHGHPVAGGDVRVARVEIHFAAPARRHHNIGRTYRHYLTRVPLEHIGSRTPAVVRPYVRPSPRVPQPPRGDQVYDHAVFSDGDIRFAVGLSQECALDLPAGDITRVENPAVRMPALLAEIIA